MDIALRMAEGGDINTSSDVLTKDSFMADYIEKLKATVRKTAGGEDDAPLAGMRICVNPGNGAGGFFAAQARPQTACCCVYAPCSLP